MNRTVEPVQSDIPGDQGNVSDCTGFQNTLESHMIHSNLAEVYVWNV